MFIMSQDKEDFINLDNVKMVTVDENIVEIDVNFAKADFYEIGAYESKDRAQEVLNELKQRIVNWENLKVGQPSGICSPVYEMPKE